MRINNIPVAGLNNTSNFVPFNNGSGFVDSGFEIFPPPINYFGNTGFQTRVGITLLDTPNSSQRTFGLKFNASPFFGAFSFIGDFDNNYTSTFFSINQFPNSSLNQAILYDNFNNQRYINVDPNMQTYGIGDDVTDATTFGYGMIVDSVINRVIMRNTAGAGFRIVPSKDDIKFGVLDSGYYIGLENNTFLVGYPLVEETGEVKIPVPRYLKLTWQGEIHYIQLLQ